MNEQDDLDAFANQLGKALTRNEEDRLPLELEMSLKKATREYQPEEAKSWRFLALFLVLLAGASGLAIWTPLMLAGVVILSGGYVLADRWLRRFRDRTLIEALQHLWNAARG